MNKLKTKGSARNTKAAPAQQTTTVWRFGAEEPPLSQIGKVFCGLAFVSVHLRPVSTPSLRSVGHSPQVHGTQAQIYLPTSPYLNVVSNACRKGKKAIKTGRAKTNTIKLKKRKMYEKDLDLHISANCL
jgi:hypothetical protein